jgi:hypothetical protein
MPYGWRFSNVLDFARSYIPVESIISFLKRRCGVVVIMYNAAVQARIV